jgi:hypothetical protein
MGIGLSEMFGLFITLGVSIPPYIPIYPLELLLNSYLFIIILAVVGAIIPAYLVTKIDISSAFTGEG